jgi:hypothetical protein
MVRRLMLVQAIAATMMAMLLLVPTSRASRFRHDCGLLESAYLVERTNAITCRRARVIARTTQGRRRLPFRWGAWTCRSGRFPVLTVCDLDYGHNISYATVWVRQVVE